MRGPRSAAVRARRGPGNRLLGDSRAGDRLRHGRVTLLPRLDRGRVVTVQTLGLGLEEAQRAAERASSSRKLGGAEEHQDDDGDDEDLGPTDVGPRGPFPSDYKIRRVYAAVRLTRCFPPSLPR